MLRPLRFAPWLHAFAHAFRQVPRMLARLHRLDPYRVLARGYALVTDTKGKVCTVEQLQPEQTICVRSRQYQARCRVETVEEINESTQKL